MTDPNSESDPIEDAIDGLMDVLREHFDNVQIMATGIGEDGETDEFTFGAGNWHARVNMARAFVMRADELERDKGRRDANGGCNCNNSLN